MKLARFPFPLQQKGLSGNIRITGPLLPAHTLAFLPLYYAQSTDSFTQSLLPQDQPHEPARDTYVSIVPLTGMSNLITF
jgi:hypothetical protein